MKKIVVAVGSVVGAVIAFCAVLVVFVNLRGGVSASYSRLAEAPVLGGLLKVKPAPEDGEAAPERAPGEQLAGGREMPFLRFGPEARLARLAQELELKRTEYEALLGRLGRRERELEAWQRQLKLERDNLREKFGKEQQELAQARDQIQQEADELRSRQLALAEAERSNLKSTADIYGRMSPQKGAAILSHMYESGDKETVVKIIHLMGSRSAAKTLEAFTDTAVSADVTEQLKRITTSQ